jgi:hypothetical protein
MADEEMCVKAVFFFFGGFQNYTELWRLMEDAEGTEYAEGTEDAEGTRRL